MRIEQLFKKLHKGIYEYGEHKLAEATELGYIESTMGFKLHLPEFDKFKDLRDKVEALTRREWDLYKEGKIEWQRKEKLKLAGKPFQVLNKLAFDFYKNNKSIISQYFKLKSQYFRLCLNNPTQTTAAHQIKKAACLLFDYIKENHHLGKAKICIIPHDEFVMEVKEDLAPIYKEKLGFFMRKAGNSFIKNPLIKMGAEGNIGDNWYEAK